MANLPELVGQWDAKQTTVNVPAGATVQVAMATPYRYVLDITVGDISQNVILQFANYPLTGSGYSLLKFQQQHFDWPHHATLVSNGWSITNFSAATAEITVFEVLKTQAGA
jgi:hypothetical protein